MSCSISCASFITWCVHGSYSHKRSDSKISENLITSRMILCLQHDFMSPAGLYVSSTYCLLKIAPIQTGSVSIHGLMIKYPGIKHPVVGIFTMQFHKYWLIDLSSSALYSTLEITPCQGHCFCITNYISASIFNYSLFCLIKFWAHLCWEISDK